MTTATRPAVRLVARDVTCPVCSADPDEPCVGAKTGQARANHTERAAAARADSQDLVAVPAATITVDTAGTAEPAPTNPSTEGVIVDDTPALTQKQIAQRLLVIKALKARVAEVEAELRAAATETLDVGDNIAAYLDGDPRRLGRVGLAEPSVSWKVEDPQALQAWVAQYAPTEIVTTESVRNSFVTALVEACKGSQGGWVNPRTGEVLVPTGIVKSEGRPTLRVTGSKELDEVVADAIAAGRIRPDGTPLALPAADVAA